MRVEVAHVTRAMYSFWVLSHDRGELSALRLSGNLLTDPAPQLGEVPISCAKHGYRHLRARRPKLSRQIRFICGLRLDPACVGEQNNDSEGLALTRAPELVSCRALVEFQAIKNI